MTSNPSPAATVSGSATPISLDVSFPLPSFKNTKRAILDRNTGRMRTLTPGPIKKRMKEIEDSFACQLLSAFQAEGGKTSTALQLRSWIASVAPQDDSWTVIPQLSIMGQLAEGLTPGATIIIERIDDGLQR
jgi:hypothetical protein